MNDIRPAVMPKARKDRLIIKELPDETLVYDQVSDNAHCLNNTAALVWKSCDGLRSVDEIKAALASKSGAPVDDNVVWLALEQLERFKLLEHSPSPPQVFKGMNRRELMRNVGVVAIALPAIMTIAAPTAQAQASCLAKNTICTPTGTPCCAGCTCQAVGPNLRCQGTC